MTRDRSFAPEVMAMNLVPYMRALQKQGSDFHRHIPLEAVRRQGNRTDGDHRQRLWRCSQEQLHDQIIVNHGTRPNDELYFQLKPRSCNLGAVDYRRLINGEPQDKAPNKGGSFQLFRIGDAVAARNTHAAIYDANRLVRHL